MQKRKRLMLILLSIPLLLGFVQAFLLGVSVTLLVNGQHQQSMFWLYIVLGLQLVALGPLIVGVWLLLSQPKTVTTS